MKFLSLRWKISGILILSNLVLGAIIVYIVSQSVTDALRTEVIERGRTIGEDISRYSAELILEEDVIGLTELITSLGAFESVGYVLIQNAESRIISDTYNGNVPDELQKESAELEIKQTDPELITLSSDNTECYDIVVPVEEGSLGYIRVGMKRSYIQNKVMQTNNYILLAIVIVTVLGIIIVYFVANKIIRPILNLAQRANEISQGRLEESVTVKTNDEINYMAQAVERLRESLNIALTRLKKDKVMHI
jgi:HAMP domain-containing protein